MQAIATCEFLLSPSLCEAEFVDDYFLSLAQLHADVLSSSRPPLLEEDAYSKLVASDRFPADKVFSHNIRENGVSVFSAQDITKIIHKILADAKSLSDLDQYWLQEWENLLVTPDLNAFSEVRKQELFEFFSTLIVYSLSSNQDVCALHFEKKCPITTTIQGELLDAYPLSASYPLSILKEVRVFSAYKKFLSVAGHEFFLSRVNSDYDLKLALFAGALQLISGSGYSIEEFEFDSFLIGHDFIDSLKRNQSYISDTYFNVVFDTVISVIANMPKNAISPFHINKDSTIQRLSSDKSMKAFRVHITSSGLALRLMFWLKDDGRIVLANIGRKSECEISE